MRSTSAAGGSLLQARKADEGEVGRVGPDLFAAGNQPVRRLTRNEVHGVHLPEGQELPAPVGGLAGQTRG